MSFLKLLTVGWLSMMCHVGGTKSASTSASHHRLQQLPAAAWIRTRRFFNFGSLFGSATYAPSPYDRVMGHPVFSVTTAWGSPYMNMEKLSDLDPVVKEPDSSTQTTSSTPAQSISEEQNEIRTVVLYFMDPDDALAVHGEMKQMESMEQTDIRITSFSLARAIRQASNFGNGLPTGAPPDPLTGKFAVNEGAALRYKIVPPKRQLYYAARCIGRERVGLFGDTPAEDAQTVVLGNSALEATNLMRRRDKRERKSSPKQKTPLQAANAHMEGYSGIPVFFCPQMLKQRPFLKRFITGQRQEMPFFFNYEDLEQAWQTMRQRNQGRKTVAIPEKPDNVEVFNLWDLLTSMDKNASAQPKDIKTRLLAPFQRRFGKPLQPDLHDITFVPSSRSVQYKERISARGNGKARLRPMR